jgi:DNA-binding PadR family transcriptional regulator
MIDAVDALILDLLEWLAGGGRSYEEVMGAWRTSCPRLPVWEDANDRGLITTEHMDGCLIVRVTPRGRAYLEERRPSARSEVSREARMEAT